MIDFRLDEPLALLAEAFGQESDGAALVGIDADGSAVATLPSTAVIAASAAAPAKASAYSIRAE